MSEYARSLVEQGQYTFPCPYVGRNNQRCEHLWEYFLVRHVAALSPEEMQECETKMAENYSQKAMGVQNCPGCSSFCMREKKTDTVLRCPICTTTKRKAFNFCWSCLRETPGEKCIDRNCDGSDPRVRFLRDCPMTKMGYTNIEVPNLRACPNCGILITHISGCKQMVCSGCKTKFCFVCITVADKTGKYACGNYNTPCTPAARQSKFP